MLHSTDYREFRKGKRYHTSDEREMSYHGSTEEIANKISSENGEGENPEIQTLTQEAVSEQIRGFIAPLTRQIEVLTGWYKECLPQGIRIHTPGLSSVPFLVRPCLSPTLFDLL